MMNATNKILKAAVISAGLFTLGACQHTDMSTAPQQQMRNSVQMVRLPLEINRESDGTDTLSNVTIGRINSFLASIEAGYGDVLMLDAPNASPERIKAVETMIRSKGLVYAGVSALGTAPTDGSVMLYVERYQVTPPNCNYWPEETSVNARNNDSPFHGCSNTINLGLMVADPRDLVSGRSSGNSTAAAVSAINPPSTSSAPSGAQALGTMLGTMMGAMGGAPSGGNSNSSGN
jgi:pilus assembly protein CpaD